MPALCYSSPVVNDSEGVTEFSAGGVVLRDGQVVVIVPRRRAADGSRVLGLPKGHPHDGETPEQTAVREIREETGVIARALADLGEISYSFRGSAGVSVAKRVRFFLFEYVAGDVADHDDEVEEAFWMAGAQARSTLTYEGERAIVGRALSISASDR